MNWQFTLSVINSAVIIITLVILVFQTWMLNRQVVILQKQTKAVLDSSSAQGHAEIRQILLKMDEVFVQMPELRKYFYEGVPLEKSSPLYTQGEAVAELLLDIMEHMAWQTSVFPELYVPQKSGTALWNIWYTYFDFLLVSSPLLLEYLEKRRDWYPPQLTNRMERAKSILLSNRNETASPQQNMSKLQMGSDG